MIEKIAPVATAQISISAITTAILCPIAVIMIDKHQKNKGIYGRKEYFKHSSAPFFKLKQVNKLHFYESVLNKKEE